MSRSMSRWSRTATSPGWSRPSRLAVRRWSRAGPWTPGSVGAGRERTANFMTAPWCQPVGCPSGRHARSGAAAAEQLAGVGPGAVGVLDTGEHPRQLLLPLGLVEGDQAGGGDRPVAGLVHDDVPVGVRRHLGQVRDDQDLRGRGPARRAGGRPRSPPCRRRRRRPRRRRRSAPSRSRPATPRGPASRGTARRRTRPCAADGRRRRCWPPAGTRRRRHRARWPAASGRRRGARAGRAPPARAPRAG